MGRSSESATDVVEVACDPEGAPVQDQVVEAVAAYLDADLMELEPLYTAVDPDALNTLIATAYAGSTQPVEVTFRYADVTVSVHGEGAIYLSTSSTP